MFYLRRPTASALGDFLRAQAKLDLTYAAVGATSGQPPPGYVVDCTRVNVGVGRAEFEAARESLQSWRPFQLGWVEAWPTDLSIDAGAVVAILARVAGLWCVNACRIVYVIDEANRFGFAYGTLPGHVESGEERFLVEHEPSSGTVWYDILAFSRPRHPLARLAYPLARRQQRRFARDSAAAMIGAVRALTHSAASTRLPDGPVRFRRPG